MWHAVIALMGNLDITIDAAFITAVGGVLLAVGATVRTFFKDRRSKSTVAEVADETKTQLTHAAENVYAGVTFLQTVLDEHKADMLARYEQDRAVWVGGLSTINKKVDRLDDGHRALVEMMSGLESRLPNPANRVRATRSNHAKQVHD